MPCKNLEGYLAAKEELLMEALLNNETNWNLISESVNGRMKVYQKWA